LTPADPRDDEAPAKSASWLSRGARGAAGHVRLAGALRRFPEPRRYPRSSTRTLPTGTLSSDCWRSGRSTCRSVGSARSRCSERFAGATLGRLMQLWAGGPVDRHHSSGAVEQLAALMQSEPWFWLGISTRRNAQEDRSPALGFYHLALKLDLPVRPGLHRLPPPRNRRHALRAHERPTRRATSTCCARSTPTRSAAIPEMGGARSRSNKRAAHNAALTALELQAGARPPEARLPVQSAASARATAPAVAYIFAHRYASYVPPDAIVRAYAHQAVRIRAYPSPRTARSCDEMPPSQRRLPWSSFPRTQRCTLATVHGVLGRR